MRLVDHVLDHVILDLVTIALQSFSLLAVSFVERLIVWLIARVFCSLGKKSPNQVRDVKEN